MAGGRIVIPYAFAGSDKIDVGAKAVISKDSRNGVLYVRYGKLRALLEIKDGDRNIDILNARGQFYQYSTGAVIESGAGGHVGVVALAVAPQCFLAVDHRPAKPAHLVVRIEIGEVVRVADAEAPVLLPQSLVHEETAVVGDVVGVAFGDQDPGSLLLPESLVKTRTAA